MAEVKKEKAMERGQTWNQEQAVHTDVENICTPVSNILQAKK